MRLRLLFVSSLLLFGTYLISTPVSAFTSVNLDSYAHYLSYSFNYADSSTNDSNWVVQTDAAGDFNGDGIDDLVLGFPEAKVGGVKNAGLVAILFGGSDVAAAEVDDTDTILQGSVDDKGMGKTVAYIGDVNADGKDDLFVESSSYYYIMFGDAAGESVEMIAVTGFGAYDYIKPLAAMDINGDGYQDVGVVDEIDLGDDSNNIYLHYGPIDTTTDIDYTAADVTLTNMGSNDLTYTSAHNQIGDLDGNGIDDLLVSVAHTDSDNNTLGIVLGGDVLDVDMTLRYGAQTHDYRAAAIADINGDQIDDLIVTLKTSTDYETSILFGQATWPSDVSIINDANVTFSTDYEIIAAADDFNGDGLADLALISEYDDYGLIGPFNQRGKVFIVNGRTDWPDSIEKRHARTIFRGAAGRDVHDENWSNYWRDWVTTGDIDGDGKADLFLHAPLFKWGDAARLYTLFSTDTDGDGRAAIQGDCDDSNADYYPGRGDTTPDNINDDCDIATDEGYTFAATTNGVIKKVSALSYERIKVTYADNLYHIFHPGGNYWKEGRATVQLLKQLPNIILADETDRFSTVDGYSGTTLDYNTDCIGSFDPFVVADQQLVVQSCGGSDGHGLSIYLYGIAADGKLTEYDDLLLKYARGGPAVYVSNGQVLVEEYGEVIRTYTITDDWQFGRID